MKTNILAQKIKILLIEDNEGDARLIREMLIDASHTVFEVNNAATLQDGLALFADIAVDVIICDLSLPDSCGLATLRSILNKVPDIPVVVLSGLDDEESAIKAVQEGAQDYLIKGQVSSQLLAHTIQYALERKKMMYHLVQSKKMESIGQLAAGMAHEINTPIQYVGTNLRFVQNSFAQLVNLLREYEDLIGAAKTNPTLAGQTAVLEKAVAEIDAAYIIEEAPKAMQHSLEGIERVSEIVQALYEFAQVNNTGVSDVDVNRSIKTTLTVANKELTQVAEISTDLAPALSRVRILPVEFNQVLLNILFNAAQAIRGGERFQAGKKGRISVHTEQGEFWVEVRISDTGPGIPTAIRDKIFDPFFTTKEIGDGLGHGLAFSHKVISHHGGSIRFETREGEGTTFIIQLPKNNVHYACEGTDA